MRVRAETLKEHSTKPCFVVSSSGASLGGRGVLFDRSATRTAVACALAILIAMLIGAAFAGSASAEQSHPYTGTSFGPDGVGGSAQFPSLRSLTVDQSSGDLYAYDGGEGGRIYKFDAAGHPLNFSGLVGNFIGEVGSAFGGAEYQVAVAPPGSPAGTAGDIYVANGTGSISVYGSAGNLLGKLSEGNSEVCGVATDPSGSLYVGIFGRTIRKYVPTKNPPAISDEVGSGTVEVGLCNIAADGLGNVYAANFNGEGIFKLEGLSDATPTQIDPSARTLAIDPATNDLYGDRQNVVVQYDSTGTLIGKSGLGRLSESRGVAFGSSTGTLYVANSGKGTIDLFGPQVVVPTTTTEAATAIKAEKATLHGIVNPENVPITSCEFEYGTTESLVSAVPCEATPPTDGSNHEVTAQLSGLESSTGYSFRLVARNSNGAGVGETRSFNTTPRAETGGASPVGGLRATVHGTVFPEGEAVEQCVFEYGKSIFGDSDFASSVPCEGATPPDEAEHEVTAQLTHLHPNGSEYLFRLSVTTAAGTFKGSPGFFSTEQTVVTGGVGAVGPTAVTVEGTLNPEGIPYTDCTFEYGTTKAYDQVAPCSQTPAQIGVGSTPVPVSAELTGLAVGGSYHYRLRGTNEDGSAFGADASFFTSGALIESEGVGSVSQTEATVEATINPRGDSTSYFIQYGPTSSFGLRTPSVGIGAGVGGKVVRFNLTGLAPLSTYHFRFVAVNSSGETIGDDSTFTTSSVVIAADNCANSTFRVGFSAALPDCRAYEMVSPIDKKGADTKALLNAIEFKNELTQTALSGNAFTYTSYQAFGGSEAGARAVQYLAKRTDGGWESESLLPRQGIAAAEDYGFQANFENEYKGFSPELCDGWLAVAAEPPLDNASAQLAPEVYRRDNCGGGSFEATLPTSQPERPTVETEVQAISGDGRAAVIRVNAKLTAEAAGEFESQAYFTRDGNVRLICVLPSGLPANQECSAGTSPELSSVASNFGYSGHYASVEHSMSADGSSVYWTASDVFGGELAGTGRLYLRLNPGQSQSAVEGGTCTEVSKACTLPVSETVSGSPARFLGASTDGSKAIYEFTSGPSAGDLYLYTRASESSRLIAEKTIGVAGVGNDLADVYFVSEDVLPGTTGGVAGKPNLYVDQNGTQSLIATLSRTDVHRVGGQAIFLSSDVDPIPTFHSALASADGKTLSFVSTEPLTGYDNTDAASKLPCGTSNGSEEGVCDSEVFVYKVGSAGPSCVSCNPTGARPHGRQTEVTFGAGGTLPAAAALPFANDELHRPQAITSDGDRLFFNSYDSLTPRDNNGKEDVYEWEAAGSNAECQSIGAELFSRQAGGCLSLISSGQSPADSEFLDADPTGRDAFFTTEASLVPQDPGLFDIYDARELGGYPAKSAPVSCEGEACQGPLVAPQDATPGSLTYQGPGNVKHKAKHHKKKHHKKKQRKQQSASQRRQGKQKNSNRGAAR